MSLYHFIYVAFPNLLLEDPERELEREPDFFEVVLVAIELLLRYVSSPQI